MPNFDTIKLEKGMYATGRPFAQVLEEMDPSANYKGTELEGLDAYQRQLKRFDIRVSGANSDSVEKFFRTSDSSALFPEYVSRAVRQGLDDANILPRITATVTKINSLDYRTAACLPSEDMGGFEPVSEGDAIPEIMIKTQDNLVRLQKRGRMLVASYEAIRFERLDLFTVTLKQIGAYIARAQLKDAVDTVMNGDGNANPAETVSIAAAGSLTYADLIKFWNGFDPYELNALITAPDVAEKLLNLTEMRDAAAGLNFQGSGKLITPLGAELIKTPSVPEGTLIGLDRSCAIEMVQAGDVITDFDKLIDRQLERAAITSITGFAKIFVGAGKALII